MVKLGLLCRGCTGVHLSIKHPKFSYDQRQRLQKLSISDELIQRLEVEALPVVKGYSHSLPPLAEVEESLLDVKKHLLALQAGLEKLRRARGVSLSKQEAFDRLCHADYQVRRRRGAPAEQSTEPANLGPLTTDALEALTQVFRAAEESLPRERSDKDQSTPLLVQRRKRSYPQAIEAIWMAIGGYDQSWSGMEPPITVSSKQGHPFWELVRICNEAVGVDKDNDPSHAIKLFIQHLETQGR